MSRYNEFYNKFKGKYNVPESHLIVLEVAKTPLWLREFFKEQGRKQELSKRINDFKKTQNLGQTTDLVKVIKGISNQLKRMTVPIKENKFALLVETIKRV